VKASDGVLMFSQKGRFLWTRHEALAQVQLSLLLPLPAVGNPHAGTQKPALSMLDHLSLNLLQLKVWPTCLLSEYPSMPVLWIVAGACGADP
jgi:hypothetical protein